MPQYVIGLDYGTDSARALIVDCASGAEVATHTAQYPRWSRGEFCVAAEHQYRQHPQDYIDVLQEIVTEAIKQLPDADAAGSIVGIGIDTTGSTPIAVDENGVALALRADFADNPNAMFILWKDHTGIQESEEINNLAHGLTSHAGFTDYTQYCGGAYSPEWFWAKVLHITRADPAVAAATETWIEHCDWLPGLLSADNDVSNWQRSRCAAGHKAMWHESWGGLPSEEFLVALDPCLAGLRARLYTQTACSDEIAGSLSAEWAATLGLPVGIPIAVGALDAHHGAVGSGAGAHTLVKVMGTSACDLLVAEGTVPLVPGICGQVNGSILPGAIGLEAGQSAFGDVFAWFRDLLGWPLLHLAHAPELLDDIIPALSKAAEKIPIGCNGVAALDWFHGRRSPDVDARLRAAIAGMNLGSDAPTILRALIEAVACGSRAITQRFLDNDIEITDILALGGVAKKSPLVMQVCADMTQRSISVVASDQCCALGAAIFAAVVAGVHKDVTTAQQAMASSVMKTYVPDRSVAAEYDAVFARYEKMGVLLSTPQEA